MSYNLEIRPDALADIEEAATWYEEREKYSRSFPRHDAGGRKETESNAWARKISLDPQLPL